MTVVGSRAEALASPAPKSAGWGPARIVVVDGDLAARTELTTLLGELGHEVRSFGDAAAAQAALGILRPDLVITELSLPGGTGLDLCWAVRAVGNTPIIVLTERAAEVDKVVALEIGANDYITKPYSQAELVARVRAALRNAAALRRGSHEEDGLDHPRVLKVGALRLDPDSWEVWMDGRLVALRRREFEILELLARNAGHVVTRERLLALWGPAGRPSNTLEVHIRRLRAQIEPDPRRPSLLLTVRGIGYRLTAGRPGHS